MSIALESNVKQTVDSRNCSGTLYKLSHLFPLAGSTYELALTLKKNRISSQIKTIRSARRKALLSSAAVVMFKGV